jgi:hypothetical protein
VQGLSTLACNIKSEHLLVKQITTCCITNKNSNAEVGHVQKKRQWITPGEKFVKKMLLDEEI